MLLYNSAHTKTHNGSELLYQGHSNCHIYITIGNHHMTYHTSQKYNTHEYLNTFPVASKIAPQFPEQKEMRVMLMTLDVANGITILFLL